MSPELKQIMQLYVDRFNRRDWDGVRELTRADAALREDLPTRPISSITNGGLGPGDWRWVKWTANRW
jgi:hypothetical protein